MNKEEIGTLLRLNEMTFHSVLDHAIAVRHKAADDG
tara:strand:- start:1545 stop:1652 length:108 start_codon:yes stop_codon:yes gene_type:complete